MPTAYVLVLLDYNYPDYEIMSQLSKLACVTEVNRVDGPYDIIVKLSDNNMDTIKESIGIYRETYDKNPRNSIYFNINVYMIDNWMVFNC